MGYISDTLRENFSVEILWKLFSCRAYSQSVVIYANKTLSRFFLFFVSAFSDDNVVEIIRTKLISPRQNLLIDRIIFELCTY